MRVVINDFSNGIVDSEYANRTDLAICAHSVLEAENFFPGRAGRMSKRGGLRALLASGVSGIVALIPWTVSVGGDQRSFVVTVRDRSLQVYEVIPGSSDDKVALVPVNSQAQDGTTTPLILTSLDAAGRVQTYSAADADRIQFAQCDKELSIACAGKYPLFYLKFETYDPTSSTMTLSSGIYTFVGNIASNPAVNAEDETKAVDPASLIDALRNLPVNTDVAVDGGSYIVIDKVQKSIVNVRCEGVVTPRSAYLYVFSTGGGREIVDSASACGVDYTFGSSTCKHWFRFKLASVVTECTSGVSCSALLDRIEACFAPGTHFCIGDNDGGVPIYVGWGKFSKRADNRIVRIRYTDAGQTKEVVVANGGAPVKAAIIVSSSGAKVNGGILPASKILSNTIPWMEKNVTYQCDTSMLLNGQAVLSAMRVDTGKTPSLLVWLSGETEPRELSRGSPGLIGRVGVILTPFYGANEPGDHPTAVCYHQGRLVIAKGNYVYLSKVNDFSNFCYFEEIEYRTTALKPYGEWTDATKPETRTDTTFSQQIGDTSAIRLMVASEENESVQWLCSAGDLVIGTANSMWIMPAEATANDARLYMVNRIGSSPIQAKFAMGGIVFVGESGQRVFLYDPASRGEPVDITDKCRDYIRGIDGGRIRSLDFSSDPFERLYLAIGGIVIVGHKTATGIAWTKLSTSGAVRASAVSMTARGDKPIFVCDRANNLGADIDSIDILMPEPIPRIEKPCALDGYARGSIIAGSGISCAQFANTTAGLLLSYPDGSVDSALGVFNADGLCSALKFDYRMGDAVPFSSVPIPSGTVVYVGFQFTAKLRTTRIDTIDTDGLAKEPKKLHVRVTESSPITVSAPGGDMTRDITSVDGRYPVSDVFSVDIPSRKCYDPVIDLTSRGALGCIVETIAPSYEIMGGDL